jgi:hypothetical protein
MFALVSHPQTEIGTMKKAIVKKLKGEGTGTWLLRSEACWECADWPCAECEPDTEILDCVIGD